MLQASQQLNARQASLELWLRDIISRLVLLEQRTQVNGGINWKKNNMMNNKMPSSASKFDGDAEKWTDLEFVFSMVVASENSNFDKLFDFLRDHDGDVTDSDVETFWLDQGIDQDEMEWMCDGLYMARSARTTSTPLSIVEGLRGDPGFARGARAWKRISKSCFRVQHPKRLDPYREVTMALERWEVDARELERTTGKDMADLPKL